LKITVEHRGEAVVVVLAGELDVKGAPELNEALAGIEAASPSVLVLDLGDLEFIDSTGLRTILEADARQWPVGFMVRVVRGSGQVGQAFRATGVDEHLSMFDDVEAAINAERSGPGAVTPRERSTPPQ
jgi:anti-anti-sigma factor